MDAMTERMCRILCEKLLGAEFVERMDARKAEAAKTGEGERRIEP